MKLQPLSLPYEYSEGHRLLFKFWGTPQEREAIREACNILDVRFHDLFRLCFNAVAEDLIRQARAGR